MSRSPRAIILILGALFAAPAYAQLDPGLRYLIVQDGMEAGQILVPPDQDACKYVEYWFVYEDFTFVGLRSGASFSVEPAERADDHERFVKEMWEAHPKGKLLTSVATESGPGCE